MNPDSRNGAPSLPALPARTALDNFFLDARARLLDLAAILDRIDRGGGAPNDPRMEKLWQALALLQSQNGGRAERLQELFSLKYDPNWEKPKPR
jgi:hypothetical protein